MSELVEMDEFVVHKNSFLDPLSSTFDGALVLLNSDGYDLDMLKNLWTKASGCYCADGGANRLYDSFSTDTERTLYIPSLIIGDLDSLRKDVWTFYESNGCTVEQIDDCDTTDLEKCLLHIFHEQKQEVGTSGGTKGGTKGSLFSGAHDLDVVLIGAFGGRFDHTMASIQALYKWSSCCRSLVIADTASVTCLLQSGKHRIDLVSGEGPHCGLLPVGCACDSVTTTGLQWNLFEQRIAFGELISTSNICVGSVITVETSCPVIWTISNNNSESAKSFY